MKGQLELPHSAAIPEHPNYYAKVTASFLYEFIGKVKFWEREFLIFRLSEYYLKNIYGDYMQLFSEEQRH